MEALYTIINLYGCKEQTAAQKCQTSTVLCHIQVSALSDIVQWCLKILIIY